MWHPVAFLSVGFGLSAVIAHAGDTSWQLYFDRHPAIGDRCQVSSSGSQHRRVETSSPTHPKEITEERLDITYAACHEVRALDPSGRPTEIRIRIDRLLTNDGSGPQEQLPAGTLITATAHGDQTRYLLGRDELDGTLTDALNLAGAKLPSSQEPSEDAVFLNNKPRRPGEHWTADPKRLADAIAATSPFIIDPVTSTAEIRFDEPVTENGIPALATTTTLHVIPTSLRSPMARTPLTDSRVNATTIRVFPVDPLLPLLRESIETTMKLIQRADTGPLPAGTETTFSRKVTRHIHPLPPG